MLVNDSAGRPSFERVDVSVLVVGAGAAGARAAIELAQQGVDDVLVLGKRAHGDAHTKWARGGVNAALGTHDPEDSPEIHAADTLREGQFLNDPDKVETLGRDAPDRVRELDDWGMEFSRTEDGEPNQRFFGAQSFRRTAFAGDHTGESMLETLVQKARDLGVDHRADTMITKLLSDGSRVHGALGYDMDTGEFVLFNAGSVVLAAGGYTALYDRHSSRDDENTADGPALAYEAGAAMADMEFVQFHPTGMVGDRYDGWDGRLVTEAVRGEGGHLRNAEGERFMEEYAPDQMELAARDVVARAIEAEIEAGRGTDNGGVYLDISHRERSFIKERLPRMFERFDELGVDMATEPVEVAPTAHYGMGGVVTDGDGETSIDGLYAIGETMAGVHGANRLGGNSLAETLVFGRRAGADIAGDIEGPGELPAPLVTDIAEPHFAELSTMAGQVGEHTPEELLGRLRNILEDHASIRRDANSLSEGLDRLDRLREEAGSLAVGPVHSRSFEFAIDLGYAFTVARAILEGSLERTESRGAHFRRDHPERDADWRENIHYRPGPDGSMRLEHAHPGDPSPAVQEALDTGYELDYHQLE